jgi:hypothetical protein
MSVLILIGVPILIIALIRGAEEAYYNGLERQKERVMATYYREEEARAHHYRLDAIEAARRQGIQELNRIAAEARGEVIESTAIEVRRDE